jgi:hypothetical protein
MLKARGLLLILSAYPLTGLYRHRTKNYWPSIGLGAAALFWIIGLPGLLFWGICVSILLAAAYALPSRPLRILLFTLVVLGANRLRTEGYFSLGFWWIFLHWIRFFTLTVDLERNDLRSSDGWQRVLVFLLSPPLLIGPFALEFLSFRLFQERLSSASQAPPPKFASGITDFLYGAGLICLLAIAVTHKDDLLQLHLLPAGEISATTFSAAIGWGAILFFLTYLKLAGVSYMSSGMFQQAGLAIAADFRKPFLSKNYLDFCRRHNYYAAQLLARYFYFPVVGTISRRLPAWLSIASGIIAALAYGGLIHFTSVVPSLFQEFDFQRHYSLQCSMENRGWEFSFLFATFFYFLLAGWLGKRVPSFFSRLLTLSCVLVTLCVVSLYFFNNYALCWRGASSASVIQMMLP